MPRDYARRSHQNRAKTRTYSARAKVWLCIALLIVSVILGLSFLRYHAAPSSAPLPSVSPSSTTKAAPRPEKKPESTEEKVHFDFYTVLPGSETLPANSTEKPSTIVAKTPPSPEVLRDAEMAVMSPSSGGKAVQASTTRPASPPKEAVKEAVAVKTSVAAKEKRIRPLKESAEIMDFSDPRLEQKSPAQKREHAVDVTKSMSPKSLKASLTDKTNQTAAPTSAIDSKSGHYILQIAALRRSSAADQLRVQLAGLGYDVHMTSIHQPGVSLQRIWLGPYPNLSLARHAQSLLHGQHISGVIMKFKQ